MGNTTEDQRAFDRLELRIQTILPEEYQDNYEDVEPVSMGSAAVKYGPDGKVEWDEMWDTFCDLAMAGGPPHKGKLLQAASQQEIEAQPERYQEVVAEICRGIQMVTDLKAEPSPIPGWVRVECMTAGTAGWLLRAIVMENVSARSENTMLYLPAGPSFRVEKEIKNVITVMAKTGHYWLDHTWSSQQRVISDLFALMERESPLIQPTLIGHDFQPDSDRLLRDKMAAAIEQITGLQASPVTSPGWLGVSCPDVKSAIWMMRAMVVSNVLSRREETLLFVPVNPLTDPTGDTVVQILARIHSFAKARSIV